MAKKPETFDEITPEVRAAQPHAQEDYEPIFDRHSPTRRVLGQITDDVDALAGNQPRNTISALTMSLALDTAVPDISSSMDEALEQVQAEVDKLVGAGLVAENEDGTLALTDDGWIELCN